MKKILLVFLVISGFISPFLLKAQIPFSVTADTVYFTVGSSANVYDNITNLTASPITIRWHVDTTNFPEDWLSASAFGICDNSVCLYNVDDTFLWRVATGTPGNTFTSGDYSPGVAGVFDLSLSLASVAEIGTYWVTVTLSESGVLYSKNITFIISKVPASVPVVPSSNDILLYPNPANNELNLVYSAANDIKNIAVYNIIGKVMTVYKVSGNSANLNIENLPSGIYFVRLFNGAGNVVSTRKFTKQ